MEKGYIQVYTGDGKGKTTAALGLAIRALGKGKKVAIIQFLKKSDNYGEYLFLSPKITFLQFGFPHFIDPKNIKEEEKDLVNKGIEKSREIIFSGLYDIVILDEILVTVLFKMIDDKTIVEIMKNKPNDVELILTGRGATKSIIENADLVTEMKEIKHYFKKGVEAREGIEF
uniref:Cob(I)yrinic acid a,c-diamide adenosyltransferase n=1 Tax=candidate division WOR-3 bacterium TaxID=2052148 RepID=A0A7C3J638_UNCW3